MKTKPKSNKHPLRWIAAIAAVALVFALCYTAINAQAREAVLNRIETIITAMFPAKDISISIEGETEVLPHEPGGQAPSTEAGGAPAVPGFVIYYDTERYVMTEEDGVTYIRFELDTDLPPCEMEIRHLGSIQPAAAAEAARAEMLTTWPTVSEISPVDTPEGLHFSVTNGMNWDSAWENMYFVSDGQSGTYRIISRYFVEAAEGHGARFAAMLQTFEIIQS